MIKHIVFLIGYIYFLYIDLKRKEIDIAALAIYALMSLVAVAITRNNVSMSTFMDSVYSLTFGLIIYLLSYFSMEGIGIADGLYFVINGLLLTLKENILLFFTGLLVAFVIGIFMFYFGNAKRKADARLPFIPCVLPFVSIVLFQPKIPLVIWI